MLLNEKLDKLISQMPESAHKIRLMQASSKLAGKINEGLAENESLMHTISEFCYTFLNALGFSAATCAAKDHQKYKNIIMSLTFSSVAVLIPYLINLVNSIKKNGGRQKFQLSIDCAAQMGSVLAFISTFNAGALMLGKADNAEDEIINFLVVAMATVYSMPSSFFIIQKALNAPFKFLCKAPALINSESSEILFERQAFAEVEKIKSLFFEHRQIEGFNFLIIIFAFCFLSFNEGAKKFVNESGFSNIFALNFALTPICYIFSKLIFFCYKKTIGSG